MKNLALRISLALFLMLLALVQPFKLYALELDDLYEPLLQKGKFLYKEKIEYFKLREEGTHGNASYDRFSSTPYLYFFDNSIRFSSIIDAELGFKETYPSGYKRLTYNPAGSLSDTQKYNITYFRAFLLKLRARKENSEFYLTAANNGQKSDWNWATAPNEAQYFSYIRSNFQDIEGGIRYLSPGKDKGKKNNSTLSKIKRPLLCKNQLNLESSIIYKKGKVRRNTSYYSLSRAYNFYHTLMPHASPNITMRWGLKENPELESGLCYTTPLKYKYEYKQYNADSSSLFVTGNYKLENSFRFPLRLRYRSGDSFEAVILTDFDYCEQKLDYQQKNTDNTVTTYPVKRLKFYNVRPALRLTYLFDGKNTTESDEFSSLTKDLLNKNQCLLEFEYEKDITHLDKKANNGAQNIIDPYNIFLYPLDYFMIGSEHAAFFAGNTTNYATNVIEQNYYKFKGSLNYGLRDNLNIGLGAGYHSDSSLHTFTLYDKKTRFYRFKPYLFFELFFDWRVTKTNLISFKSNFVPNHVTFMSREGDPKDYESKTRYFNLSLSIQTLF